MKSNRLELFSRLSPAECLERLRETVDTRRSKFSDFWAPNSKSVAGRMDGERIRLRLNYYGRNSFRVFLTGVVRARDGGTVIQGIFSLHPIVHAFLLVWFSLLILMSGSLLVIALCGILWGGPEGVIFWWLGLAMSPLILPAGIALVWHGCRSSRNEPEFLEEFLRKTLEARNIQDGCSALERAADVGRL